MADKKITELTALATPAGADLLEIVDDVAGTPTSKKVTVENLINNNSAVAANTAKVTCNDTNVAATATVTANTAKVSCTTANVNAAGATMNTDTDVKANSWVLNENDLTSDSDTKVATQQSIKAYIDNNTTSVAVSTGHIAHGSTIPLPSGYSEEQCKWMVSPGYGTEDWRGNGVDQMEGFECHASGTRVVTARSYHITKTPTTVYTNESANYIIIGVK